MREVACLFKLFAFGVENVGNVSVVNRFVLCRFHLVWSVVDVLPDCAVRKEETVATYTEWLPKELGPQAAAMDRAQVDQGSWISVWLACRDRGPLLIHYR